MFGNKSHLGCVTTSSGRSVESNSNLSSVVLSIIS